MNTGFEFLRKRGISSNTVKEFNILYFDKKQFFGFSENLNKDLIDKIRESFKMRFLNNNIPFPDCIVFPVFDLYSNFTAIFMRRLEGEPKFDASFFKKSQILYGLNKTYTEILNKDSVFITEGIFDFLMLWQNGIRNSVSALGCNLSFEQMCLCLRFTKNFIIIFDPDNAGKTNAIKAKELILKFGGNCKIIFLKDGLDLDDYICKYGINKFLEHVKNTPRI